MKCRTPQCRNKPRKNGSCKVCERAQIRTAAAIHYVQQYRRK